MAVYVSKELRDEIRIRLGIDESVSGETALIGAVSRCMTVAGITDAAEYNREVLKNRQLFDALIDELVVPESWFFRDEKPFEWLAEWALAWRRKTGGVPLRILSAPCAGGQEPYSVAIVLLEAGMREGDFTVEAGDISERNLAFARAGVYKGYAFRGQRIELRDRYFRKSGDGCYAIDEKIRAMVKFRRLNLLNEVAPPEGKKYHVILCRNVLIYLTADARQRVWSWLDSALEEDGILFYGHADDASVVSERFEAAGKPGAFCLRRRPPGPAPAAVTPAPAAVRREVARRTGGTGVRPRLQTASVAPVVSAEPVSTDQADRLAVARRLADAGRLDEAASICREAVAGGHTEEGIYVLYASILGAQGKAAEAERMLRSALFLNPHNGETLLQLALLVERRGDHTEAGRLRKRLRR